MPTPEPQQFLSRFGLALLLEAIGQVPGRLLRHYWVTVLGAEQYPVLGAMMVPKTIACLIAVILLYRLAFPARLEESNERLPGERAGVY